MYNLTGRTLAFFKLDFATKKKTIAIITNKKTVRSGFKKEPKYALSFPCHSADNSWQPGQHPEEQSPPIHLHHTQTPSQLAVSWESPGLLPTYRETEHLWGTTSFKTSAIKNKLCYSDREKGVWSIYNQL